MAVEHLPYAPTVLPQEAEPVVPFAEPETPEPPHISILTSNHPKIGEQVRWASQSLHTDVYLERKYINESELNEVGFYVDDYIPRSTYYYVRNSRKVAAARQIHCDKKTGIMSLPTAKEFGVNAEALAQAAEVSSVADLKPRDVVEISALASKKTESGEDGDFDAVISLYSKMMRDSIEAGHKLWLLNTDPGFVNYLSLLVGEEQIHKLGEPRHYMGPPTTPVAINPQAVMRQVLGSDDKKYDFHKAHIKELFKDIDARRVPQDLQDLFDKIGVEYERSSRFSKYLTKEEVALQGLVLAYSSARAFPAGGIDEFNGSVAALWGIDISTAIPYTHGMIKMYGERSVKEKAKGAAIAIPSFLAPYAYLYAEGNQYPAYVNVAVGAFIGTAVAKEIVVRKLRARKERRLGAALRNIPEEPSH